MKWNKRLVKKYTKDKGIYGTIEEDFYSSSADGKPVYLVEVSSGSYVEHDLKFISEGTYKWLIKSNFKVKILLRIGEKVIETARESVMF